MGILSQQKPQAYCLAAKAYFECHKLSINFLISLDISVVMSTNPYQLPHHHTREADGVLGVIRDKVNVRESAEDKAR